MQQQLITGWLNVRRLGLVALAGMPNAPRDFGVAAFVRDAVRLRSKRTDEVASVGILVPHLRHI